MAHRPTFLALALAVLAGSASAEPVGEWWDRVTRTPERDIHLTEARIHINRGRFRQAVRSLTQTLHEHPNNLDIAYTLANLHYRLREYDEAISLLRAYLDRSSPRRNLYYALGLAYHKTDRLRDALGMYARAVQLDPGNLKGYVRLAQVRMRQGLPYDARKVLAKALEIDPEYLPALEEMQLAERAIKTNGRNVFRRRNLVVFFHDHAQYGMIERAFPVLDRFRRKLEDALEYHIPMVTLRLDNKVRRFQEPPALYDEPEDTIRVEAATMEQGNYEPILHEIAIMYLKKASGSRAPYWLMEGLALHHLNPRFLKDITLRTTAHWPVRLPQRPWIQRDFLRFDENSEAMNQALGRAFLVAKYFVETYGLVGIRKVMATFRGGEKKLWGALWKALRLDRDTLERRLAVYGMRSHYFRPVVARTHP